MNMYRKRETGFDEQYVATIMITCNPILRTGIEHALSGTCFHITAVASDISGIPIDFPESIPILVILDAHSGILEAVDTIKDINTLYPSARTVVLSNLFDRRLITSLCELHSNGLLLSQTTSDILLKSLELIMIGGSVLPPADIQIPHGADNLAQEQNELSGSTELYHSVIQADIARLSRRELEILRLLPKGHSNKSIARMLGLAEETVKVHLKAILRKLGVRNRTQAAMLATSHLAPSAENLSSNVIQGPWRLS